MPKVRAAGFSVSLDGFPGQQSALETRVLHATSVKVPSFDFLFFFGRMTLMATASSEVLMCDA